MNPISHEKGQSLIELLLAIGIFIIMITSLSFLIIDNYLSGRLSNEITQANFLTEEGMEATRSIRDNSWDNLVPGSHGLAISGGHWVFQGTQDDISSQLKGGTRVITVEDIYTDRKQITSKVNWQFSAGNFQEVQLITYLTNWQRLSYPSDCIGTPVLCEEFDEEETTCFNQEGCVWIEAFCGGVCTPCDDIKNRGLCQDQDGCNWVGIGWFGRCAGACVPCDSYKERTECRNQLGCAWYSEGCAGSPTPCEAFTTEEDCISQNGCEWVGQ